MEKLNTVYAVYFDSLRLMPEIVCAYTTEAEAKAHVLARAHEEGYETLESYYEACEREEVQDWYTVVEVPVLTEFVE